MLSLLKNLEAISACRDRDRLPGALLRAAQTLLGEDADIGILAREAGGAPLFKASAGPAVSAYAGAPWRALLDEAGKDGRLLTRRIAGRNCAALRLHASEVSGEQMLLACDLGQRDASAHAEAIASLARMYANQIKLLDYSELDSLTRLLNRKTFDETFDRLLTAASADAPGVPALDRRERRPGASPAWLCVIDIDHFKRVNDSFGHLFGDEVLLRMGDLMRKTFRSGDRLFRFGGEEFVVILNAENESLAETSFDRFRAAVESHEFPQVGKVTCSTGFTGVSSRDVPTDVVGRADEALYYAKSHGRNRVCCHERLVSAGAIATAPAPAQGHFIDALFN